jgi:uncharacterized protein YbaA (DUF1428 family)
MAEFYRVTVPGHKPETYQSLSGAADRWREAGTKAVVEQVSGNDDVIRVVDFMELRRCVDRARAERSD